MLCLVCICIVLCESSFGDVVVGGFGGGVGDYFDECGVDCVYIGCELMCGFV